MNESVCSVGYSRAKQKLVRKRAVMGNKRNAATVERNNAVLSKRAVVRNKRNGIPVSLAAKETYRFQSLACFVSLYRAETASFLFTVDFYSSSSVCKSSLSAS